MNVNILLRINHEPWTKRQDVVTGFEGRIVGICLYLTGCNQYYLVLKSRMVRMKLLVGLMNKSKITDEKIIKLPGNKVELQEPKPNMVVLLPVR